VAEELFPLWEKEIEKKFDAGVVKFKLKELRGLVADKIMNEAKRMSMSPDKEAKIDMDIAVFNEKRILASVVSASVNDKEFDIKKEVGNLPRKVYTWLIKEIDNFNKVGDEEEKNSEQE